MGGSAAQGGARRGAGLAVALACLLSTRAAVAEDRTAFLVERLKADDFRVRTNAALALGATNDEAAVQPLCGVLADRDEVVRQAAAAALKRLSKPSSLACIKARIGAETSDSVRLQLTRAAESISAASPTSPVSSAPLPSPFDAPPKNAPAAKLYVSVSPVNNATGRAQADVDRVVLGALRAKLEGLATIQLAPRGEAPEAARAVLAKRKLKGYYLSVSVDKFEYVGGNLKVSVKLAVFSYPSKDLKGEVPAGLTQTGVRPNDARVEDNLMGMAAAHAVELFAQNFK